MSIFESVLNNAMGEVIHLFPKNPQGEREQMLTSQNVAEVAGNESSAPLADIIPISSRSRRKDNASSSREESGSNQAFLAELDSVDRSIEILSQVQELEDFARYYGSGARKGETYKVQRELFRNTKEYSPTDLKFLVTNSDYEAWQKNPGFYVALIDEIKERDLFL